MGTEYTPEEGDGEDLPLNLEPNQRVIPGFVWWLVYNWLDMALEKGWEQSEWFHGDCMLRVRIFPNPHYVVGILPLGLDQQTPTYN